MSGSALQAVTKNNRSELTVVEIDAYLTAIVNTLKHGKEPDRELAFKRCDKWLDLRLKVVNNG